MGKTGRAVAGGRQKTVFWAGGTEDKGVEEGRAWSRSLFGKLKGCEGRRLNRTQGQN